MKLNCPLNALPSLTINHSIHMGFCSAPFDSYWNAKYIFELSPEEFQFEEVYKYSGKDIPDDLYLFCPYLNRNYEHVKFAALGRSLGESKLRIHLDYNFTNWAGNISLQIFCSKLASQINRSPNTLVSSINRDLDSVELLVDIKLEDSRIVQDALNELIFNVKTSHELIQTQADSFF